MSMNLFLVENLMGSHGTTLLVSNVSNDYNIGPVTGSTNFKSKKYQRSFF